MRYIYKITNLINGKCYIGQTNNFEKRIKSHQRMCASLKYYISRAINKYGKENFTYEILQTYEDSMADALEKENIIKFNSLLPFGYNLISGGNTNKTLSQETKDRIRRSNTGKIKTQETKEKISKSKKGKPTWMKGKSHSEETKRKISIAGKGRPSPHKGKRARPETLLKMSASFKGRPAWNKGIPMSEEQKKKLSLAHLGKPGNTKGIKYSEERKKKMSDSRIGIPSPNKGKKMSEAQRLKLSEVHQNKSQNPSGTPNVFWEKRKKKWSVVYKKKYIGSYKSIEDAKAALLQYYQHNSL